MASLVAPSAEKDKPLLAVVGATGSGKSGLAVRLAEEFGGEVLSCDSVAVYRGMDLGTAKPSAEERARVRHHLVDVLDPDKAFTAGDYSRAGRAALAGIGGPAIVAGGDRALSAGAGGGAFCGSGAGGGREGEAAGAGGGAFVPGAGARLDPVAAAAIHPNDKAKLVRAVEVSLAGRRPMTAMWEAGRERLVGYRVLKLGLRPERAALYDRINRRAAGMFAGGLVEETRGLLARYGPQRAFDSLGYREAGAVVRGQVTVAEAVERARQGHRNYAKRQGTWFRADAEIEWMDGFGEEIFEQARERVRRFLEGF